MLASYWDAGYVQLDVTDPANPSTSATRTSARAIRYRASTAARGQRPPGRVQRDNQYFADGRRGLLPYRVDEFTIDDVGDRGRRRTSCRRRPARARSPTRAQRPGRLRRLRLRRVGPDPDAGRDGLPGQSTRARSGSWSLQRGPAFDGTRTTTPTGTPTTTRGLLLPGREGRERRRRGLGRDADRQPPSRRRRTTTSPTAARAASRRPGSSRSAPRTRRSTRSSTDRPVRRPVRRLRRRTARPGIGDGGAAQVAGGRLRSTAGAT